MDTAEIWNTLGTLLGGGVLGSLGTAAFNYLTTTKAQTNAHELAVNAHLLARVTDLEKRDNEDSLALRKDNEALRERVTNLEVAHEKCHDDNLRLTATVGNLQGQMEVMKGMICPFPPAHTANKTIDAQQTAGG